MWKYWRKSFRVCRVRLGVLVSIWKNSRVGFGRMSNSLLGEGDKEYFERGIVMVKVCNFRVCFCFYYLKKIIIYFLFMEMCFWWLGLFVWLDMV